MLLLWLPGMRMPPPKRTPPPGGRGSEPASFFGPSVVQPVLRQKLARLVAGRNPRTHAVARTDRRGPPTVPQTAGRTTPIERMWNLLTATEADARLFGTPSCTRPAADAARCRFGGDVAMVATTAIGYRTWMRDTEESHGERDPPRLAELVRGRRENDSADDAVRAVADGDAVQAQHPPRALALDAQGAGRLQRRRGLEHRAKAARRLHDRAAHRRAGTDNRRCTTAQTMWRLVTP